MKIVMSWEDTDGCTYSCTVAKPIEYRSVEGAIIYFELAFKEAQLSGGNYGNFLFAGAEFNVNSFVDRGKYYEPTFQSLEDWFEGNLDL